MAIIGNNADTLLNALSDFWHRFFADTPDLQAIYEGTEIQLGQAYLDLLNDVLNVSVEDAPLFQKQFYKLLTIREDQVVFNAGGGIRPDVYVYTSDTLFGSIPQLHNKVFNPTAALEETTDYTVGGTALKFVVDPTNPVPAGFATRSVDVVVGGFFSSKSQVPDWTTTGVKKGDRLVTSAVDSSVTNLTSQFTIVHVAAAQLALSTDTPSPQYPAGADPIGHAWRIERDSPTGIIVVATGSGLAGDGKFDGRFSLLTSLRVSELSLWAVDAMVDTQALYRNFGHLFGAPRSSSESYRAFIRGLMQLYILGPAIERMESALNVVADLPVVRNDGEVLQSYDNGLDASGSDGSISTTAVFSSSTLDLTPQDVGGKVSILNPAKGVNAGIHTIIEVLSTTSARLENARGDLFVAESSLTWEFSRTGLQVVTTNSQTYNFLRQIPMRADVMAPANIGVLTFQAFEPLTDAINVTDYIEDPEWWHNITIPVSILPDVPLAYRVVSPQLYPNIIGPVGGARIGDPGYYVGANEDGVVSSTPFRHQANFILMDKFLKMHLFSVSIDPSIELTDVKVNDLERIVQEVKPSHTQVYLSPQTLFKELITAAEQLFPTARLPLVETFSRVDNTLRIGGAWTVGQTWAFASPTGGAINSGSGPTPGIPLVIGGTNPNVLDPAPALGHQLDGNTMALWRLDGNGTDTSANHYDLTVYGATPQWDPGFGDGGQSWWARSSSSSILLRQTTAAEMNAVLNGSWTVSFFMKPTGSLTGPCVLLQGFDFSVLESDVNLLEVGVTDGVTPYIHVWETTSEYQILPSPVDLVLNAWQLVTVSKEATTGTAGNYKLYINDQLVGSWDSVAGCANPGALVVANHYWAIGGYTDNTGVGNGVSQPAADLDDVMVSTVVRTPLEVADDWARGSNRPATTYLERALYVNAHA